MTGHLEPSIVDRFAHALARIVHDERPDALSRPVTVAELYQDIAPYRRMRELAGIEMHADYEHALIRFLAGEGGYARLDPDTAADELGIEAESADPDLAVYRKFAACDVRLSFPHPEPSAEHPQRVIELPPLEIAHPPARAPRVEPPKPEPPKPESPKATLAETMRALDIAEPAAPSQSAPSKSSAAPPAPVHAASAAAPAQARCAFCGYGLPQDREVRFCPYCGVDQNARQCPACGSGLEAGWRFCVACGAAAGS